MTLGKSERHRSSSVVKGRGWIHQSLKVLPALSFHGNSPAAVEVLPCSLGAETDPETVCVCVGAETDPETVCVCVSACVCVCWGRN